MSIRFLLVSADEVNNRLYKMAEAGALSPLHIMLFGGDRITCCDEAMVAMDGETFAGLATIAPNGEQGDGEPTIVGLFVFPQYRRQGLAREIFRCTIDRCKARSFTKVRIDVLSGRALKMIHDHFAHEVTDGFLDLRDYTGGGGGMHMDALAAAEEGY